MKSKIRADSVAMFAWHDKPNIALSGHVETLFCSIGTARLVLVTLDGLGQAQTRTERSMTKDQAWAWLQFRHFKPSVDLDATIAVVQKTKVILPPRAV